MHWQEMSKCVLKRDRTVRTSCSTIFSASAIKFYWCAQAKWLGSRSSVMHTKCTKNTNRSTWLTKYVLEHA